MILNKIFAIGSKSSHYLDFSNTCSRSISSNTEDHREQQRRAAVVFGSSFFFSSTARPGKEEEDNNNTEMCESMQRDACRLCICCEGCPCATNPYYFLFLFLMVVVGVIVILVFVQHLEKKSEKTSTTESSKGQGGKPKLEPVDGCKDASYHSSKMLLLDGAFSAQEQSIVLRAIDLWDENGMLPSGLANKLRGTESCISSPTQSKTASNNNSNNRVRVLLPAALIISAIAIALLESTFQDTTVFHTILFGPWMWLLWSSDDDQALAKALAMMCCCIIAHCRYERKKEVAFFSVWEMARVFFMLAYIGSLTYAVVDTGRHKGETTYKSSNKREDSYGSNLWYSTVGSLGSLAILCLGQVLPEWYKLDYLWTGIALLPMTFQDTNYYWPSLQYGISACLLLLGVFGHIVPPNSSPFAKSPKHYLTTGTIHLIIISTQEPSWWFAPTGSFLGLVSVLLIFVGMLCRGSVIQASVATIGFCISCWQLAAISDWSNFSGGLNIFLRLELIFTMATFCIGGWKLPRSYFVSLPPNSKLGCSVTLVAATLILLLFTIVVGNSHEFDAWKVSMDFAASRKWYEWDLVDGNFSLANRSVYILPWALPFFIYYRALSQFWPEVEQMIRPLHTIRIAILLVCLCHLMRTVSWSMLFLILGGITIYLPRIEAFFCGGA